MSPLPSLHSRVRTRDKSVCVQKQPLPQIIAEMAIGLLCYNTSARCAVDKAALQKLRLIPILQRHRFFSDAAGQRFQTNRSSLEALNDPLQILMVDII